MKILPVIDLLHGQVVHAIAGRRHEYRPVVSRLTDSCRPVDVALAFRDHFGFNEVYVADLDAIGGSAPDLMTLDALRDAGFDCWVDVGVRDLDRAVTLADHAPTIVAGLETVPGPDLLAQLARALGNRVVFSLDLKDGKPLGDLGSWPAPEPYRIARHAVELGVHRLLILDLTRVGTGTGPGTEALCAQIVKAHPDVELFAGGGIRTSADIRRFADLGVSGLLVASALHNGTWLGQRQGLPPS